MNEKRRGYWLLPILPAFTLLSLGLSYFVSAKTPFLGYYANPIFIYTGLFLVCLSVLLAIKNRLHFKYRHDLFATGCLVIWFSYWQQYHSIQDAPLFLFYPLFFALFSIVLSYNLVWSRNFLDMSEIEQFLKISRIRFFTFPVLMLLTLASLLFPYFLYQAFAITMSFFMIRHGVVLTLELENHTN